MIFAHEVRAVIKGDLPHSQIANFVELAEGGFHCHVLPEEKSAFTAWLARWKDQEKRCAVPVEQMDLLKTTDEKG